MDSDCLFGNFLLRPYRRSDIRRAFTLPQSTSIKASLAIGTATVGPVTGADDHVAEVEPEVVPSSFAGTTCRIRRWLVGLVFSLIPGSRGWKLEVVQTSACLMMFSRVKLPSHCFNTCNIALLTSFDSPAQDIGYLPSAIGQPPQRRQDHQHNGAPVYSERKLSIRWDPSSAACLGSAPPSWQAWIVSETALYGFSSHNHPSHSNLPFLTLETARITLVPSSR